MTAKIAFVLRVDWQLVADLVADALIGGRAEFAAYPQPAAGDTTMVLTVKRQTVRR